MKALDHEAIKERYLLAKERLGERGRREWAAAEAMQLGYGGISAVARASGLSATTIRKGIAQLGETPGNMLEKGRQRRPGGGAKRREQNDPRLVAALKKLVEPHTRGKPMSPLLWTGKSTPKLAAELARLGHKASPNTVARLLRKEGYSLQSDRRQHEGATHPDRDAQFLHIAATVEKFQKCGCPVISVDAQKKELAGNDLSKEHKLTPKGCPEEVRACDFIDECPGKLTPGGTCDLWHNEESVNVGVDGGTAQFAVGSIGRWWTQIGGWRYPRAREILIIADCGGSNSARARLWKKNLQEWADRTGLTVTVCHFPPGTSKWNKIEHRMFCEITKNWRGKPLVSHRVIIELIAAATTKSGLKIQTGWNTGKYPKKFEVTDAEMAALAIVRSDFRGEWNYAIKPRV
jgi:hypothetical protein